MFFDVINITMLKDAEFVVPDKLFIEVCEKDTINVISVVPSMPVPVGVVRLGNGFVVQTNGAVGCNVRLMISGIRKGFKGRRFARRTQADFERNTKMWQELSGHYRR